MPASSLGHLGHREQAGIELHLQGAHAGGELGDAGNGLRAQMLVQHVHPGPHGQVQQHRPVLDQHTAVAFAAQCHVGAVGCAEPAQHAVVVVAGCRDHQGERRSPVDVDGAQRRRAVGAHRNEPHRVARCHLAQLPAVAADHGDRTDEPAQARPVGTEQDRGVAGEVQTADAVGVVVNVRWMQSGLTAVAARPLRFRAQQPHPGAIGIEVHGVVGRNQRVDIGAGKEFRCGLRAFGHRDLPAVPDAGLLVDRRARPVGRCAVRDRPRPSAHRLPAAAGHRDRRTRRA